MLQKKEKLITGINPDFGMIEHIHSHRADIFGVLILLLFLQEYGSYFLTELTFPIKLYCNNEVVITKLTQLIADINYFDEKDKIKDLDTVTKLKGFLPLFLKYFI